MNGVGHDRHEEGDFSVHFIHPLPPVRKQELKLDMEQQTGSKSGKESVKAVYYHPTHLTSMQNTS